MNPAKGSWICPAGNLFTERMIPVRIACTFTQIEAIAELTAKYYKQQAVMYYRISDYVTIKHYPENVKCPYKDVQQKVAVNEGS
jgi:hypothetical protein